MLPVTHDNGELFSVEGSNMALARFCHPGQWARLSVEWKLAALALGCEALEIAFQQPKPAVDPRYKKAAPIYVRCQQKDTHKIREGIPGHGPQRVTSVYRRDGIHAHLECGCSFPISWLPIWERNAVLEFQKFLQRKT
jgi:hypothetical protein